MRGFLRWGLAALGALMWCTPASAQPKPAEDESTGEEGAGEEADTAVTEDGGSWRRSNRMEFDERLVKGQTASSGAVYLFKRVPRNLPGLVPLRRSYRSSIVEPVLGDRELQPAIHSETDDPDAKTETATPKTEKGN